MPVLHMVGKRSTASAHGVARLLAAVLPRAEVVEFEALGHIGPVTHAKLANAAIAEFLQRSQSLEGRPRRADRPPRRSPDADIVWSSLIAMPVDRAIVAVPIPDESRLRAAYGRPHLADAYEVSLPEGAVHDPEALARFIFASQPRWVSMLMQVRDLIVGRFGLKTGRGLRQSSAKRIGLFRVYESASTEVILGEDDRHLDFRVSVLVRSEPFGAGGVTFVVVSTVVHCHNRLGRLYIFFIAPFHRLVVKADLRRAASSGWPLQVHAAALRSGAAST
jgi:hypothetical protein